MFKLLPLLLLLACSPSKWEGFRYEKNSEDCSSEFNMGNINVVCPKKPPQ